MVRRKTHTIYLLTINDVPYVGQTGNYRDRKRAHRWRLKDGTHHNSHLQSAYDKYGSKSLSFNILEKCYAKDACRLEAEWIRIYDSYKNGFNQSLSNDGHPEKPCEWNGVEYQSVSAAAHDLGINPSSMYKRLKNGYRCDGDLKIKRRRLRAKGSKLRDTGSKGPLRQRRVAVVWNGVRYPSKTDAARALGISYNALDTRLKRGYKRDSDIPERNEWLATPCQWNGIDYPSYAAAAEANGVTYQTIVKRIENGYTCDDDMPRMWGRVKPKSPPKERPLKYWWNGTGYASFREAAKDNGISASSMFARISKGYTCDADMLGSGNYDRD